MCVWQTSVGYSVYGCYLDEGGQKIWSGYSASTGNTGGIHNELCPHTPVPAGESCAGHEDQFCHYPSEDCLCEQGSSIWNCQERPFSFAPPVEVERVCSPVEETKLVKDLTDEELDVWCRWSLNVLGTGSQLFGPSQPPFDARNYGDRFGGLHNDVCQPILPPDLCARNIRLKPDCDATVRTLNDCIETIQAAGALPSGVVGHGCAPLLDNSTCTDVVVMKWGPSGGQCPLPLD